VCTSSLENLVGAKWNASGFSSGFLADLQLRASFADALSKHVEVRIGHTLWCSVQGVFENVF
jgi:hypothetical protein